MPRPETPPTPVPFARPRTPLGSCWWLLPAMVVIGADVLTPRVAVLGAVLAGAAWQVLARRDVLDRLTPLAAVALVSLALLPLLLDEWPATVVAPGLGAAALVAVSVLLTEQVLRLRDTRLATRGPARPAGRGVGPRS